MRAMALRVLREMVRCQPEWFHSYAELTILKLLEAHKDPVKEVKYTVMSSMYDNLICRLTNYELLR